VGVAFERHEVDTRRRRAGRNVRAREVEADAGEPLDLDEPALPEKREAVVLVLPEIDLELRLPDAARVVRDGAIQRGADTAAALTGQDSEERDGDLGLPEVALFGRHAHADRLAVDPGEHMPGRGFVLPMTPKTFCERGHLRIDVVPDVDPLLDLVVGDRGDPDLRQRRRPARARASERRVRSER